MKLTSVAALLLAFAPVTLAQSSTAQNWDSLDQQLEQAYLKGDLAESLRLAKLAVDAASNPKQSGRSLDRLGYLYYVSGNLKDGEAFLRKGIEIRRSQIGGDTAEYAESANDLALFCRDTRKLDEARTLAEQAVEIRTRVLGPKDPLLAETMETLGSIYSARGEYEQSASTFAKARAIYESQLDPKNPMAEYGTLLVNIGGNDERLGKYQKAEADFETALQVLSKNPGVNHPIYATSLMGPALLETELGHYALSEKYYNQAAELLKKELGDQHPMYVQVLDHRATLFQSMGNFAAAEADYTAALAARRKIFGPNHVLVAATLRNYGRLVYVRNRAEGEKLLQESADIYSKSSDHPPYDFASVLLSLGEAQKNRGDLADARKTFQQALDIASQGLGEKHPLYASVLNDLALVHQAAREFPQAEQRFQQAIDIVTETQGPNHPDVGRYVQNLAALYDQEGKYRAAEPLYRRSFEINDAVLTGILNIGSESNKLAEISNLADPIPALLSFQERAAGQVPEARALAFEAVARRKGRVLDEVRDWRERLRLSSDPAVLTRFNQWEAMLECQSSLSIALGYRDLKPAVVGGCSLPGTELEGRYERLLQDLRTTWSTELGRQAVAAIGVLQQRRDALEAALSRESPQFGASLSPARLKDIQSHLDADELFVEFVAYQPHDEGNRAAQRYGAFVIDASRNLHWLDLGPAAPVDQAVRDLFEAANDWSIAVAGRENRSAQSAEQTAQDALRQLSKSVLAPLEPWLAASPRAHRIRIAPDGMLTLVPFGALVDAQGRYLLERFAIGYVPAGRDLAHPQQREIAYSAPVIALSPGATGPGVVSAFRADHLDRLEGAATEARRLQQIIPRAQLLAEGEATEERVKQLHSPALLHIVGHGVVRGNEDCKANPASPGCAVGGLDAASRVMSLSAIVLEEAYRRGPRSSQDGLLTALELETVDLQGTQLLVLSQCQMADGVPSSGEGVYGMRRAAAIAGVRTFVAPLWKVADAPEQALMERFYKELSAGRGRAEALRAAQLQLLKNPATHSFLYWAPVILSGDTTPLPQAIFQR
ncbi:MAG TPA: CHAT domain-containing tetratricopeptide repeat protein [Bryobacteraceae bacterium]|nr:CHAT domain-containing tetratricopeptide repeat protein [Bryobacteraceae bacterium]